MGCSLSLISREAGLTGWEPSQLSPAFVKKKMKYSDVPPNEQWRTGFLTELLSDNLEIPGFTDDELEEMVSFLCTS